MQRFKNKHWSFQVMALAAILVCMNFGFTSPVETLSPAPVPGSEVVSATSLSFVEEKMELYTSLDLGTLGLSREAFEYGLTGYERLVNEGKIRKDNLLSILDFSMPSGKKRLFVIDIATGELVFHTYAAHGRNSGTSLATQFSNEHNSFKSSLGFYITGETYNGKHGTSLRLKGEEQGINDNALSRGIVIHGAAYVDESIVKQQGFIGRSQGCPALSGSVYKEVINTIKSGSCLFLYSPDKQYVSNSKMLSDKA